MPGFDIAGDAELNADGTDMLLTSEAREFKQRIIAGFLLFLGQWIYDQNEGIDYEGRILGQNLELAQAEFRDYLLGFPEVDTITKLELVTDRQTRELMVEFEVQTEAFGLIDLIVPVSVVV